MLHRLRWIKQLIRDLPQQLELAYCLVRDPRVPLGPKVGVVGVLGLVVAPVIDLPEEVPLVGELDVLALTLLSLRVFIALVNHCWLEQSAPTELYLFGRPLAITLPFSLQSTRSA